MRKYWWQAVRQQPKQTTVSSPQMTWSWHRSPQRPCPHTGTVCGYLASCRLLGIKSVSVGQSPPPQNKLLCYVIDLHLYLYNFRGAAVITGWVKGVWLSTTDWKIHTQCQHWNDDQEKKITAYPILSKITDEAKYNTASYFKPLLQPINFRHGVIPAIQLTLASKHIPTFKIKDKRLLRVTLSFKLNFFSHNDNFQLILLQ